MTNLNPLAALDSLLADYAGPKARRAIHSLILLAGVVVTVYLAAGSNWKQAIITLALSLYAEANKANTPGTDLDAAGADTEPDDGLSYEEAGGLPYDESADVDAEGDSLPPVQPPVAPPLVSGQPVTPVSGNPEGSA